MKTPSGSCRFLTCLVLSLVSGFVLAAYAVTADAAKNNNNGSGFTCSITDPGPIAPDPDTLVTFTGTVSGGKSPYTIVWHLPNGATVAPEDTLNDGETTMASTTLKLSAPQQPLVLEATETGGNGKAKTCTASLTIVFTRLTARGDTYATPVGKTLTIKTENLDQPGKLLHNAGLLYNDFATDPATGKNLGNDDLTVVLVSPPTRGNLTLNSDNKGGFTYTPTDTTLQDNDNDSFTYRVQDAQHNLSQVATVNIHITADQPDFKIMMNYELGMHCTGFEFSYCCILPPYNSIIAQVVKAQPGLSPNSNADYPRLLTGDPEPSNLDPLGREVVLRDYDGNGGFQKYYLEYYHDAMPRREGNMPGEFNSTENKDTLISAAEGNSLLYWNTPYDSALVDDTNGSRTGVPGKLVTGSYGGLNFIHNVVQGDGSLMGPTDNFANGWLNHFYIYADLEGTVPGQCTAPAGEIGKACAVNATCGESAPGEKDGSGTCDTTIHTSLERNKIRLGVENMIEYPPDCGAALHPLGPETQYGDPTHTRDDNTCGGFSEGNVLTFSGDAGTVVYTQMKVLENLPIMLTSPRIWEALGLPLTPFEDSIAFFSNDPLIGGPGSVNEDTIRPFVAMKTRLLQADCDSDGKHCTKGDPVLYNGKPVIGFGSAPIDIPNCERCHSAPAYQPDGVTPNVNSPNYVRRQDGPKPCCKADALEALVDLEINYWKAFYGLTGEPGNTDWYARLKGAAISIEAMHDMDCQTNFTLNYPVIGPDDPTGEPPHDPTGWIGKLPGYKSAVIQNTRMGHEAIICQKCHSDNVIAVVKAAGGDGFLVPPISEAIHNAHRNYSTTVADSQGTPRAGSIHFSDSLGRFGGCQGCHPAHRSDGVMDRYPITRGGANSNAAGDNRLGAGGCFVGRDVHSNPLKDVDGTETPEHLNAVGQWLKTNVSRGQAGLGGSDQDFRGIWCTNCHTQLSQELWRKEDCNDLIHSNNTTSPDCLVNPRAASTLAGVATAVGMTETQAINYLDPKNPGVQPPGVPQVTEDDTHKPWDPNIPDANVATIEVAPAGSPGNCSPLNAVFNAAFNVNVCVKLDMDGDPSVNILSFCTTQDCVDKINAHKTEEGQWRYPEAGSIDYMSGFQGTGTFAAPVPFSAADDARDHWLAAGEPHCADCHAAPYVEPSGNKDPFPPFNYPAKASLMRYSRGHQDLSCQACHESIHGLYPVGAAIDNTSYSQAAALNYDGSHGPLKCGSCHGGEDGVRDNGVPEWITSTGSWGSQYVNSFDAAVGFAHEYTDDANVLDSTCQNCHGDNRTFISAAAPTSGNPDKYLGHADDGRTSRRMMDKAETAEFGHVLGAVRGSTERDDLCSTCHGGVNKLGSVMCNDTWRKHLSRGRVAESVWEDVSLDKTGTLCGW